MPKPTLCCYLHAKCLFTQEKNKFILLSTMMCFGVTILFVFVVNFRGAVRKLNYNDIKRFKCERKNDRGMQ